MYSPVLVDSSPLDGAYSAEQVCFPAVNPGTLASGVLPNTLPAYIPVPPPQPPMAKHHHRVTAAMRRVLHRHSKSSDNIESSRRHEPQLSRQLSSSNVISNPDPTPYPSIQQRRSAEFSSPSLYSSFSDFTDGLDSQGTATSEGDEEDEIDEPCYSYNLEQYQSSGSLPASIGVPASLESKCIKKVLVLYNPASGSRRGLKIMKQAQRIFDQSNVEVVQVALERKGHCEDAFENMDFTPYDAVCVIGGDGTVHEAINGIMRRRSKTSDHVANIPPLGLIPGGTGNSFVLELQTHIKIRKAVRHIIRGIHAPIDIFKVTLPHPASDKQPEVIYSFNSLHWGLASKVNVTAERMRWMGKAIRYTTAALLELIHGKGTFATIRMEDKDGNIIEYKEEFCLAIANNIKTAAKGMKMAPDALLNDGLVDLLLIRSHKTRNLMHVFGSVYKGTHTDLPYVEYRQVRNFSITPYDRTGSTADDDLEVAEELIDIDGELKGSTPFICDVIPRCLRVIL